MKRPLVLALVVALVVAVLGTAVGLAARGIATRADARPPLRVGSKRFTESYILAEIAAGAARAAGDARVTHAEGLGGTALVFRALEQGAIDVYPEYTGTIAEAILGTAGAPGASDLASLRAALAPRGIAVSDPLGFDNRYALAMTAPTAERLHVATLSELASAPAGAAALRFGLSPEFLGRSDGFPALARRYGLPVDHVQSIDHGLAYDALARGAIDVADAYSTDGKIARYGLKLLADDQDFFPAYQAVFLYRADAVRRAPKALAAILALRGAIDGATMTALNARAEIDRETFASIARGFARARGVETGDGAREDGAGADRRPPLLRGIADVVRAEGPTHVMLVGVASLLATLVGIPLGVFARRAPRVGRFVIGATSVLQTIPALALLCFFIPLLGTGTRPALLALFLYALLPIVRNTVAGLDGIAPALRESAAALGLGAAYRLVRVDLPLASRTILAGIRTSTVITVGAATLAAFIGAGGFGAPISTGLNLNDTDLILEGAIPAALLALLVEGVFTLLDRVLIPRGLRLPAATTDGG